MSVSQSSPLHLECSFAALDGAGHLHRGGGLCQAVWPRTHRVARSRKSCRLPETLREKGALAHYPDDSEAPLNSEAPLFCLVESVFLSCSTLIWLHKPELESAATEVFPSPKGQAGEAGEVLVFIALVQLEKRQKSHISLHRKRV